MALSTHEEKQSKTFYETLQSSPTLDLRDKQGNIVSWMCEKNISINAGGFAQLNSVIQAKRTRTDMKTGKCSDETSYYISNCIIAHTDHAKQIYGRIRNHWAIETNNHIRDVTLKEDTLQTIFKTVAQPISLMRTLIINVLKKEKLRILPKF